MSKPLLKGRSKKDTEQQDGDGATGGGCVLDSTAYGDMMNDAGLFNINETLSTLKGKELTPLVGKIITLIKNTELDDAEIADLLDADSDLVKAIRKNVKVF